MKTHSQFKVTITRDISVGSGHDLLLIAGPCQIESRDHCLLITEELLQISEKYPVNIVFKSSFDKANRTSGTSKRGPGLDEGLKILQEVKQTSGLPILSDVHEADQAAAAAEVLDIIQIPAFLCRQTDLLIAAGKTGRVVQIKKGQFLHPADMLHSANKVVSTGNNQILLCERGTCFGYRDLIVDIRGMMIMKETGYPVIFDATHSVQQMGGADGKSGGTREYIKPLVRSAVAAGVDGLFIECHPNPDQAPSDAASMLPLSEIERVIEAACRIREATA